MPEFALEIQSGAELMAFQPNTVLLHGQEYLVLTGYEGTGRRCFWCGADLRGSKLKHYCYGHMKEYYRHFEWHSARAWCIVRQDGRCANCGQYRGDSLEVHHIVPLNGAVRFITAFNLPWNLMGFCHECHKEVHSAMRSSPIRDSWLEAGRCGQLIMEIK